MFSIYKQSISDWFKEKIQLIEQYNEDIKITDNSDDKAKLMLYKSWYVKEVFDRLQNDCCNMVDLKEFRTSDFQRESCLTYPAASGLIDLFIKEGIIERNVGYASSVNKERFNYYNEPIYHELKITTIGDGEDKDIIKIEINHKWHNDIYMAPYIRYFFSEKHEFYEINSILKIPDKQLKNVRYFDKQTAFEIKIALRYGVIVCDDIEAVKMLDEKLRELEEEPDFVDRIRKD